MNQILNLSVIDLVTSLAIPLREGHLYLDPGSGSFILQIIIAALFGSLFVIKAYWRKIINFFRNLFSKNRGDHRE